jgi:hypothetical protein
MGRTQKKIEETEYPSELSFINTKLKFSPIGKKVKLVCFSKDTQHGGCSARKKHGHTA